MSEIVNASDATFKEEVLAAQGPVLVDFWAPWCAPCKVMSPILDEVAAEQASPVKIVKVDIDAYPDLAAQMRVRGIPTFMLFKNGAVQVTKTGAMTKARLTEFIGNGA